MRRVALKLETIKTIPTPQSEPGSFPSLLRGFALAYLQETHGPPGELEKVGTLACPIWTYSLDQWETQHHTSLLNVRPLWPLV